MSWSPAQEWADKLSSAEQQLRAADRRLAEAKKENAELNAKLAEETKWRTLNHEPIWLDTKKMFWVKRDGGEKFAKELQRRKDGAG